MDDHACHVEPINKTIDYAALQDAQATYLTISGMGCQNCAMRVRNGLLSLNSVLMVDMRLQQSIALVAYDPEHVTTEDLL